VIEIMLVSKQDAVLRTLRQHLSLDSELELIAEAPGGDAALEAVEISEPNLLILNYGNADSDTINLAERILTRKPRTFVVLLLQDMTLDSLQSANAAGCHNVIPFPADGKEFCSYLRRIYHAENSRIEALDTHERVTWASKVLTVFGAKGGLGKTTIAVNLAIKLAEQNKKVCIVDLDLQFGDVHIFMDMEPKDTIAELIQDLSAPAMETVYPYLTIHPSGVHVLAAPKSPEYAEMISGDRVQSLLGVLRANYDYVIVDTGSNFSDATISALEASTTILFLTGLDVSILKNSKVALNVLETLGLKKKVRTVINRAVELNTITIADVQRIIDAPIIARIPSDYMVAVAALNQGHPFVQAMPKSRLAAAITDLAGSIVAGTTGLDLQKLPKKERRALAKKEKALDKKKKKKTKAKASR